MYLFGVQSSEQWIADKAQTMRNAKWEMAKKSFFCQTNKNVFWREGAKTWIKYGDIGQMSKQQVSLQTDRKLQPHLEKSIKKYL